jgi:chromosomal replication initiator protein
VQHAGQIAAALQAAYGEPVQLELAVAPHRSSAAKRSAAKAEPPAHEVAPERQEAAVPPPSGSGSRLNPQLTFATLVEGTANRMARSAAMHVAAHPGQMYNPLFIFGGGGLGKTH